MDFFKKISPEFFLRLGLGATYLYSGYDIFTHSTSWIWALRGLPIFMQQMISNFGFENFLRLQGAGELLFAFILLAWFMPRRIVWWVALFTAAEMTLILLLVGVDPITFRDFGLLGAALALLFFNSAGYKQVQDI